MKAVYPPAQVALYDPSFSGASPPATHWTKLATKAIPGPAVTGTLMQQFRDQTCPQFDTVELPREVSTRNRHQQHGQAKVSSKVQSIDGCKGPSSALSHQLVPSPNTTSSLEGATTQMASLSVPSTCKLKTINLLIVKFHFLGDYVQTIQRYGCIDSFSTQLVQHLFLSCQSKC